MPQFRQRFIRWYAVGVCLFFVATPARATSIIAGSDTVNVGDVFTIPISVADALGLTSYQFDVGFDSSIVRWLGTTDSGTDFEAAATSGGGALTGLTPGVLVGSNYLSAAADSMFTFGSGLVGTGSLVLLQFEALAAGISAITVFPGGGFLTDGGVPLWSGNGGFGLINGQVTVNGTTPPAQVPEPATLLLVGSGLLVAAAGRRTRRIGKL